MTRTERGLSSPVYYGWGHSTCEVVERGRPEHAQVLTSPLLLKSDINMVTSAASKAASSNSWAILVGMRILPCSARFGGHCHDARKMALVILSLG